MKLPWMFVRRSKYEALLDHNQVLRSTLKGISVVAAQTQDWLERERELVKEYKKTVKALTGETQ